MEAHFHSFLTSAMSGHLHALAVVDLRSSGTHIASTNGDNGSIKQVENSRIFTYEFVCYMFCSCIFPAKGRFLLHNRRPFKTKAKHYAALSSGPTGFTMGFATRPCDVQTSNKRPSKCKDTVVECGGR